MAVGSTPGIGGGQHSRRVNWESDATMTAPVGVVQHPCTTDSMVVNGTALRRTQLGAWVPETSSSTEVRNMSANVIEARSHSTITINTTGTQVTPVADLGSDPRGNVVGGVTLPEPM